MKRRRKSKEIDLAVDGTRLTKKEKQELVDFIEQVKHKRKLKPYKPRKRVLIAAEPMADRCLSDTGKIIREPDGIDFVVINKPLTEKERKQISAIIEESKRVQKLRKKKTGKKKYSSKTKLFIAAEPKTKYSVRKKH